LDRNDVTGGDAQAPAEEPRKAPTPFRIIEVRRAARRGVPSIGKP
jgi:hypothetical protein